jgi:glycosyltransferase involved in cell wall biosynthesis
MTEVSAVIPTRNRPRHVRNILQSFANQTFSAKEIIIVDASDDCSYQVDLTREFHTLPLTWLTALPSVCIQRNMGIRKAKANWIFLCDDDIQLPPDYLEILVEYTLQNSNCGVVAGRLLQLEGDQWVDQYPVTRFYDLVFRFIFQQGIWGNIDSVKAPFFIKPFYFLILRFYRVRGNSDSWAGWPLVTHWAGEVVQTRFYSLGANLIRKDWLIQSPYDEVLDANGIGDNYGVAMGFPGEKPIHVLSATKAYHHRANENRLTKSIILYRRILALHYFLKRNKPSVLTSAIFLWSLAGNTAFYLLKNDRPSAAAHICALGLILTGQNPYWHANQTNQKVVKAAFRPGRGGCSQDE